MIREYDSTNPGEPPTHLTELIQSNIHTISIKSPGNTKENGNERNVPLQVELDKFNKSFVKKLTKERSKTENAIIEAASIWYASCTFEERLNISSKVEPITNTRIARSIGIVNASNLKNIRKTISRGIVIASPPSDGVSLS